MSQDIGDLLEVPKAQRLDVDDASFEDANEDEFADLSSVPDGELVTLSTASLDDPEEI